MTSIFCNIGFIRLIQSEHTVQKSDMLMREVMKMDERFIAERITALRLKKNVSEYRMSLELGQSKSYVQGITSGKAYPSIKQLYNICDYFGVNASAF